MLELELGLVLLGLVWLVLEWLELVWLGLEVGLGCRTRWVEGVGRRLGSRELKAGREN